MLRHLLPFVPDKETACDLRTLLEDNATIVICGPDRTVALRFLSLVCGYRLPYDHRVALLSAADAGSMQLAEYGEVTQLTIADDAALTNALRASLRMDPDALVFADFPDAAVKDLFMALMTGHTSGSAVISRHADIESTLAAWSAAQPADHATHQRILIQLPVVFIELFAAGHRPLIRSVAVLADDGAALQIVRRYQWREFPFVPGRDEDLDIRYRKHYSVRYDFHLATGKPRKVPASAPEHLVTAAKVKAWAKKAGPATAGARAALVPICKPVTEAEKVALAGAMQAATWPRSPAGKPAFLVAAFTVPTGGCGPLTAGQRFHLWCNDIDGDEDDPFYVVVTSAEASPVSSDILREHYLIRQWVPIADRPQRESDNDDEPETCYAGNKLLGCPRWWQGEDTPTCPTCQRPMELFLQLDGGGGEMVSLWGDAILHIFSCAHHPGTWKTIQQYD